jgi:methionyl-tRNA formyltransferase
MRVLFLGNNRTGLNALLRLKRQPEDELVGLVVHPPERAKNREEILAAAELPTDRVFNGAELGEAGVLSAIAALQPDIGVSVMFGYILRRPLLELLPAGCINVHPALLPFNRGSCPNVWSIVDRTPAGATVHFIDEGIDTGDIVAQLPVPVEPTDTGESLYYKLETACVELFERVWPLIRSGQPVRTPQPKAGVRRRKCDVEAIDEVFLDQEYKAGALIDLLRARTFPPHQGAFFCKDGQKYYLRLQILHQDELK